MTYTMKLNPKPFSLIESGMKTIELRLFDEKRKEITVGDTILFTNTQDENKQITCTVKKLHIFKSFEELYQALPLQKFGYLQNEIATASAKDMEEYYSKEQQSCYGVVGIEIQLI